MTKPKEPLRFRPPASMPYGTSSWARTVPWGPLRFDRSYRLAHLPLIAPDHPLVLHSDPGTDYVDGAYDTARFSLVVPVDPPVLEDSANFREIERALRAAPFGPKLAWDLMQVRRCKLHVTLCGLDPSDLEEASRTAEAALKRLGPIRFRLGGPYVGAKNLGRIYLPAFPEEAGGSDAFTALVSAVGRSSSGFFLLGLHNLLDELTEREADALREILATFEGTTVAEVTALRLAITATHDDLVLRSRVHSEIVAPALP